LGYLPEAHTDFIFAIVGEEFGLVGILFILMMFLFVVFRGFRISLRTEKPFAKYLALGITLMIGLQCLLNLGVVMGSLPTKGMPLPFLSFARSSLVVVFCSLGVLLRIEADTLEQELEIRRQTAEIQMAKQRKHKQEKSKKSTSPNKPKKPTRAKKKLGKNA
ncbi:MAG: FtsW/RodA/SpoVE family cell cycle protein, partial [Myxococcota bacterium]